MCLVIYVCFGGKLSSVEARQNNRVCWCKQLLCLTQFSYSQFRSLSVACGELEYGAIAVTNMVSPGLASFHGCHICSQEPMLY